MQTRSKEKLYLIIQTMQFIINFKTRCTIYSTEHSKKLESKDNSTTKVHEEEINK